MTRALFLIWLNLTIISFDKPLIDEATCRILSPTLAVCLAEILSILRVKLMPHFNSLPGFCDQLSAIGYARVIEIFYPVPNCFHS